MSDIRCVYTQDPGFPATDQHPEASRYKVGAMLVDAIGEPTQAEVDAYLCPPQTLAQKLAATDQWMSRGSEDTIVGLIVKGVMAKADFDAKLIERINIRRGLRGQPLI